MNAVLTGSGDTRVARTWLRAIEARDFRNLEHVELTLPPEGLVVIGDNGQGKTNFLEAIAYLHVLRSTRGARDAEVVRFGAAGFSVRGDAIRHGDAVERADGDEESSAVADRRVIVGFERASRRKRVTLDGHIPERLSDALGAIPSVTFSPIDVELVRGGPIGRRRYLDVVLATTSRRYLAALQTYRGALIRRNAALRSLARRASVSKGMVDAALAPWEPMLAAAGATLWAERAAWAEQWTPELSAVCTAIGERDGVRMRYVARLPAEGSVDEPRPEATLRDQLSAMLEAGREGDVRHGSTRPGPHRDDLVLGLGDRELRLYGSAGQQRTAAIALRILEAATLRSRVAAAPVLLFDDPFAELDERRSRAVLRVLAGDQGGAVGRTGPIAGQVILAVPRPDDIPPGLTRLARARVVSGTISVDAA
jgi:DNA replication and repair protein RecF